MRRASVEISDLAYDTRSVAARRALLLRARRARPTGTRSPATAAARRRRRRSSSSEPLDVALPQLVVPDVRAAMPAAAALFFGEPSHELEVAAVTGHEREDDDGVPAPRDPRGGRTAGRTADEHRAAGGRRAGGRPG